MLNQWRVFSVCLRLENCSCFNHHTYHNYACYDTGNDVSALGSVPAAVFCFLRGLEEVKGLNEDNQLIRTVVLAIALGGDTDTIATMAGRYDH